MRHCKLFLLALASCLLFSLAACDKTPAGSSQSEEGSRVEAPEAPSLFDGLTVSLDGGYPLAFDPETTSYTVTLPAGHPRVPLITAKTENGIRATVTQAAIPDSATSGRATVVAKKGRDTRTYTITFERAGTELVLQYDDFYTYTPTYTLQSGESFVFSSSDESAVTVDENGVLHAVAVTDTPVKIKAQVNGQTKGAVTVARVERAVTNLFLVTGQSNAVGCYDLGKRVNGQYIAGQRTLEEQLAAVIRPTGRGQVYGYTATVAKYTPVTEKTTFPYNTLYDMGDHAVNGFLSPLGATFYNATGEKVVLLQTARDGSAIEAWVPSAEGGGTWKSYGGKNLYDEALKNYNTLMQRLDPEKYEIRRTHNYWLQGETNMLGVYDYATGNWGGSGKPITNEEYYEAFSKIRAAMARDMGVTFQALILPRTRDNSTIVNDVRAAQYALANANADVEVVSRLCDIVTMVTHADKENPGWGMMGLDNVHYNQDGHNGNGVNAAHATVAHLFGNKAADAIVLLDKNGKETLKDGDTVTLKKGAAYRLTAYAAPDGRDTVLYYESSDEKIAAIDLFGDITAHAIGESTLSIETESGASVTLKIVVTE